MEAVNVQQEKTLVTLEQACNQQHEQLMTILWSWRIAFMNYEFKFKI
jgi:hypothetical protein